MNNFGISARGIVIVFLLCAAFDFVWGYVRSHSLPTAMSSVIAGLFGTAFYVLALTLYSRKDKSEGDDSHR